jgi:hypothetical protein
MNHFAFLYCCFYKWSQKVNGKNYPHAYSASVMMSFNVMLIFGAFLSIVIASMRIDIESFPEWRIIAALIAIAIFASVHGYFSSNARAVNFLRSFDASDSKFRERPGMVVAMSFGVSLLLLFSVWLAIFKLSGKN